MRKFNLLSSISIFLIFIVSLSSCNLSTQTDTDADADDEKQQPAEENKSFQTDLGVDREVNLGNSIILDAASTLPNENIIYQWQLVDKPEESALSEIQSNTSNINFQPDAAGSYRIKVIATHDGNSAEDEVVVTVKTISNTFLVGLQQRPNNELCLAPQRPNYSATIDLEHVFSTLSFSKPVKMLQAPGNNTRWYVVEQSGKIKTFREDDTTTVDFVDLPNSLLDDGPNEAGLLSMAFHPNYGVANYKVYLSFTGNDASGQLVSIISEYTSNETGTELDLNSGKIILSIEQPRGNHNGGDIAFGPDGYLYIGMGDGGGGGDPYGNGQNLQTLLGAMLRIDVDGGSPYAIPSDNPFSTNNSCDDGACPEIYAWGFRNPWRFSFDSHTGDLWLGDVGQHTEEEVNKVQLGGNYGWNYREGFSCYEGACDDKTLIDPIVTYETGKEGLAITGGYVYRGSAITSLSGIYLFADYAYGKIWGMYYDETGKATVGEPLINRNYYISSFAQANDGELYITDLNSGRIYKIIDGATSPTQSTFPKKLSETGCMDNADVRKPSSALIPYDVNVPLWTDGATKQRWLALPNNTTITIDDDGNNWVFPIGTVFVKHFYIGSELIETRTLIRHEDGDWAGYSYEWDENGLDATLVEGGKVKTVDNIKWTYPSSAQCMFCHTAASGFTVGPETLQLNRDYSYPNGVTANQLTTLDHIGLFSEKLADDIENMHRLPAMDELTQTPVSRARAYLHANCAFCHQENGTGRGQANFHFLSPEENMEVCDVDPETGDFGVTGAKLLTPGSPDSSVITLRMQALDVDRMPPLGTGVVHDEGIALIKEWINAASTCES